MAAPFDPQNLPDPVGESGVDLVSNPLRSSPDTLIQGQNAVFDPRGQDPGTSKRGGMAKINAVAAAGAIKGFFNIPLASPDVTRTWYAAKDVSAGSVGWRTSTDGFTTSSDATTPAVPAVSGNLSFITASALFKQQSIASFGRKIYYAATGYIQYPTAGHEAPPIRVFDGAQDLELCRIPYNPTVGAGTNALAVLSLLVHNNELYCTTLDGGSAPNYNGRVFRINVSTGELLQIGNAFGGGAGEQNGGMPFCGTSFGNGLWVGTFPNQAGTAGRICRIRTEIKDSDGTPVETTWTQDVVLTAGQGWAISMAVYRGDLYVGTHGDNTFAALVRKRTTDGTWSTSDTGAATDANNMYSALHRFGGSLYAVYYTPGGGTPAMTIRKYDGSSWSTDFTATNAREKSPGLQAVVIGESSAYVTVSDLTTNNVIMVNTGSGYAAAAGGVDVGGGKGWRGGLGYLEA